MSDSSKSSTEAGAARERPIAQGAKAAAEPLIEFLGGFRALTSREFQFSAPGTSQRVVKFLLGSILIGSLLELLLPSPAALKVSSIGLVNDFVQLGIWLLLGGIVALVVHRGVRKSGGTGGFSATLVPYLYITGAFFPFIAALEGILFRAAEGEFAFMRQIYLMSGFIQLGLYARILARVHGIEPRRAYRLAMAGTLVAGLAVLPVLGGLFWLEWTEAKEHEALAKLGEEIAADEMHVLVRAEDLFHEVHSGATNPQAGLREFREGLLKRWEDIELRRRGYTPPGYARETHEEVLRYVQLRRRALEALVAALETMARSGRSGAEADQMTAVAAALWANANEAAALINSKNAAK